MAAVLMLAAGCGGTGIFAKEPAPTKTVTVTPSATPTPTETPTESAAPQTWSEVLTTAFPRVVRIETVYCDEGSGLGSGFVVGDGLVMTAAHVVNGARTASVRTEAGDFSSSDLIAFDPSIDAAVLRLNTPLHMDGFALDVAGPIRGEELRVIGYPLRAETLKVSEGLVSGLADQGVDYGDQTVDRVFTTDAATNRGNSGGPAVDSEGNVIGLISGGRNWDSDGLVDAIPVQGTNYAVPSDDLAGLLESTDIEGESLFEPCPGEAPSPAAEDGPPSVEEWPAMSIESSHPMALELAQTLHAHGAAINHSAYSAAWSQFTPKLKARMGGDVTAWANKLGTSFWKSIQVDKVTALGEGYRAEAWLETNQAASAGRDGQVCTIFHNEYDFVPDDKGGWLIDLVTGEASGCPDD